MSAPIDLEALEALEKKATKGPWVTQDKPDCVFCVHTADGFDHVASAHYLRVDGHQQEVQKANAALIAAARNAFPALIAELREARKEREALREELASHRGFADAWDKDRRATIDTLTTERDALRADLTDVVEAHDESPDMITDARLRDAIDSARSTIAALRGTE